MDPWAEESNSWTPTEDIKPISHPQTTSQSSPYKEGPVDPWAEPSSSSSIPVVSFRRDEKTSPTTSPEENQSGAEGEFDPWSGNTVPVAPLSSPYTRRDSEVEKNEEAENVETSGWSGSGVQEEGSDVPEPVHDERSKALFAQQSGNEEDVGIPDDDDPWGSGAAAQRRKAQDEAEAAAQRMEILRLQEEARGKEFDEEGNIKEIKESSGETDKGDVQDVATEGAASTAAPSGWRALFNRGASKPAATEGSDGKQVPKIDTEVVRKSTDSKESPRNSAVAAAPKLWQAPSLLGGHNRTTSSTSRSSATVDQTPATTSATTQGPGWEVTTKKQQTGGGGLIQSLFGSATKPSGEEDGTYTAKEEKRTGLNRFGRGLQPPPVVSAADEEDESYETEETGIEWESGGIFDDNSNKQKKQTDLLSDDAESKPTESTVGRLLGRWRGGTAQEKAKADGSMTGEDLSWLEGVGGASGQATQKNELPARSTNTDDDWLAFIDQPAQAKEPSIIASRADSGLNRSTSDRYRISSTAKGSVNAKVPPLAPPPTSMSGASSGQKAPSPFAFRGPGQGVASKTSDTSRLVSGASTQTSSSLDAFGDFEQFSGKNSSPNPDESYRDDVMDNNASLLSTQSSRPGQNGSNSFLRTLQGRPRKSRYEYDEDEVESHDDSWSAFRDEPKQPTAYNQQNYRDSQQGPSPPIKPVVPPLPPKNSISNEQGGAVLGSSTPRTSTPSHILPPPPAPYSRPQTMMSGSGPLLPPPGRPTSVNMSKQPITQPTSTSTTLSPSTKPKTLSQGNTLTNDDLSFFESL